MGVTPPTTDRRTVLKSSAAALGIAGTGLGALALTTEPARATLSITGWSVESRSVELAPDEEVTDAVGIIDLAYDYTVSHEIDRAEFAVSIDAGSGEWSELATDSIDAPPKEDSGTLTLSGSVLQTDALSAANFAVDEGSTISIGLDVMAVMHLIRNGEVVGVADKTGSGAIAVSKQQLEAAATIGGEVTWDVSVGSST